VFNTTITYVNRLTVKRSSKILQPLMLSLIVFLKASRDIFSLIVTSLGPLEHSKIFPQMMKVCHHHNTQQQIYSPCFKQYDKYQEAKMLSCIKTMLLLYLMIYCSLVSHTNGWDHTDNIKQFRLCLYLIRLVCISGKKKQCSINTS